MLILATLLMAEVIAVTPASDCGIYEDTLERAACEEAAATRKNKLDPYALPADEVLVGVLNPERWSYAEGDKEGFLKLVYGRADSEGAVLVRCRAGEGFVLVTFDVVTPRKSESLRAGEVLVSAPARTRRSEMTGSHVSTVAIPSDHELFLAMALGSTLSVGDRRFPVATDHERRNIARFMRGCLSTQMSAFHPLSPFKTETGLASRGRAACAGRLMESGLTVNDQ